MLITGNRTARNKWFASDESFDSIYPGYIRDLARRHWTPLHVARKAATFLAAERNVKILDIGSGVGKFCLAAACHKPNAAYFGIEQRRNLFVNASIAQQELQLDNVHFTNGNFTQVKFRDYDHFYFFNSFYENLAGTDKIDDSIEYSRELYDYYTRYLYKQLEKMPAGTRLATYHSLDDDGPDGYHIVGSDADHLLKFWIKV